ncbi:MAG: TIGR03643 family protein [Candidatus Marinimicrobia bacterium]|nr:TIGR03643 family protein [Candidatus Neomarinimicrobiota bacterium]|tara:strand:- start:154 stop:366 length:213 start_codon:yes stop_codon:yes gene_type:complete
MEKYNKDVLNSIIELAWEDEVPFKAIKYQYDIDEQEVIKIMRKNLKKSSFIMWRKRVNSTISRKSDKKSF